MNPNLVKAYKNILTSLKAECKHFEKNLFNAANRAIKVSNCEFRNNCILQKGILEGFNKAIDRIQKELDSITRVTITPEQRQEVASKHIDNLMGFLLDDDKETVKK